MLTPLEIAERIEKMFDAQFEGWEFQEALEQLQEELIGAAALRVMRDDRLAEFNAHRLANPSNVQILSPGVIAKMSLEALKKSLISADKCRY